MTMRKRSEDVLRALCGQVFEDDGVSPRRERDGEGRKATSRKDLALCKQVMRALNDALQGEAGEALLRELTVREVEPAPDATRMRVHVEPSTAAADAGAEAVMTALGRATGFLRTRVAQAILRKRMPVLVFALTGVRAEEGGEDE
jgi:ribosome-binding factor A